MSFDSLLIKTCTIQVKALNQDSSGQKIESWSNLSTGINCRIDPAGGGLFNQPQAIYSEATHIIYMREQSGITLSPNNHRILIDSESYTILLVEKYYDSTSVHHLKIAVDKDET